MQRAFFELVIRMIMCSIGARMQSNVTIRAVCAEDAAAIVDIYNEYVLHTTISFETEPLSTEMMRERIVNYSAQYPYLVAEVGGKLVGYCYAHAWKERAAYCRTWETTIYLHPDACSAGIGQRLMSALIEQCKAAGCHVLVACITGDNVNSCRFHERLGFVPVSRFPQVGFKFDRYLDVLDYVLLLE